MFKLVSVLINFIRQWLAVVIHAWRDARVPAAARLMVILAPCYCLSPYDLNWDFSPGGYLDDLWIATLLVTAALRLVPRAVFGDARRAVAIGAIGLVLSVSANQAAFKNLDSLVVKQEVRQHSAPGQATTAASTRIDTFCNLSSQRPYRPPLPGYAVAKVYSVRSIPRVCPFALVSFLLAARGGNYQLYGSEDGPLEPFARSIFTHRVSPPESWGGTLFACLDKILILPEAPC
jgi:uncharacterized membrane protein YkvA (DUF1232 family)